MEHWIKQIQDFKRSGKSQREWCEEKGIRRSSLRYWLDRFEDVSIGKEIIFAEVVVGDAEC
ncbi:hypothetical protein [uncultured Dubosiella sp.]|uniref:IS66 family insertion sequence element accessory protein TnpA n=1 Tax=uncultured Dubosiella sp. TaxID=1937011 RepID=UPI0032B2444D